MKLDRPKRFSTHLMAAFVILVTGSVVLISGVLYIYFGKRLEKEFQKKIRAQRGQVELILESRIAQVKRRLRDLSLDNAIRVTMMLDVTSQLEERLKRLSPAEGGAYYYVKKTGYEAVYPATHQGMTDKVMNLALRGPMQGEILEEGVQTRLIWCFEAPVMRGTERMGSVYAVYDMSQDRDLIQTMHRAVDGDLALLKAGSLRSLFSDSVFPLDTVAFASAAASSKFVHSGPHLVLSRLSGSTSLYLLFSKEKLLERKRKIFVFIGLFSVLVLAVSAILSVILGRQMAHPLREMAKKAILISEGNKDLMFETGKGSYWEFDQLSQAFNYMLIHLKKAEEKSRYKELFENVDDAVYLVDHEGKVLDANEATYARLGYSREEFLRLAPPAAIPEEHLKVLFDRLDESAKRQHTDKLTFESSHRRTDGDFIPVEVHSRLIPYGGQRCILNVARDISERKAAERALRESEERYRSVVENSHDGIMIVDDQFRIVYVNNELCRLLGYGRSEIEAHDCREFLAEDSVSLPTDGDLSRLGREDSESFYQLDFFRKDGRRRRGKISVTVIKDSAGETKAVVQIRDITDQLQAEQEKKRLEAKLIHAQKMEAIGTLAGGIAHDFNNLLMAIQGRISLMQLDVASKHPHYEHVHAITRAVKSAANLTKQLLGYARGGKYAVQPTNLNDLIEKSSQMFSRTRKEIQIQNRRQEDIWPVDVDRGQIEQVLLNLYVNAWQAMPDGGALYLETQNVRLDEKYCRPFEAIPGNYVKISVTDTGIGMDKTLLDRIFEPFFTTKEMGKGTGLGLASAYGIIKNHNGIIRVYSEKGHGTTFNIYLPASSHEVAEETGMALELVKGNETILLVDDEEEIIEVGELILKSLGYQVLLARSGKQAVDLSRTNGGKVDLVILDMIMPEMGGRETFNMLRKVDPEIKVLLSSGYSLTRQAEEMMECGCKGFIQKPFDMNRLSQKIREIIDG